MTSSSKMSLESQPASGGTMNGDTALFKINNPFQGKSRREVLEQSKAFAKRFSSDKAVLRIFRVGGLLAADPSGWRHERHGFARHVSRQEKHVLEFERRPGLMGFLKQPKTLKLTVVVLWLSAIIQGWIQSVLNGANLTVYKIDENNTVKNPAYDSDSLWRVAGANAVVFFVASLACFLSDPLQSTRYIDRRGILFIAALLCFAAGIGAACVQKLEYLYIPRILLGIAMGLKGSVTPIFAAEISPAHLRGAIVMGWQAGDTLGIWFGFTANLIVADALKQYNASWAWQTVTVAVPSLCLALLVWTIPDSPRLYLKRGEYKRAYEAMCQLRTTPIQAARDLFYANAQLQIESDQLLGRIEHDLNGVQAEIRRYQRRVATLRWWNRISGVVTDARTRHALQSACILMVAQQLCGFNVLAFYSGNLFTGAAEGHDPIETKNFTVGLLNWGIGLCNFAFTIPAFYLIDRWGRVSLLLATYPGMMVFTLITSLVFATAGTTAPQKAVNACLYFLTFFYSLGQGPVAFTYAAEVFPLVWRESAMSMAVAVNLFGAGLLTLFVPRAHYMRAGDSDSGKAAFNRQQAIMLGIFFGLQVVAFIMIFCFVPETARCTGQNPKEDLDHLSLEELNCVFQTNTRTFANYRFQKALPSFRRRAKWSMWDRFKKPQPRKPPHPITIWRWQVERGEQQDGSGSDTDPSATPQPRSQHRGDDGTRSTHRTNRDHEMTEIPWTSHGPPMLNVHISSSSLDQITSDGNASYNRLTTMRDAPRSTNPGRPRYD